MSLDYATRLTAPSRSLRLILVSAIVFVLAAAGLIGTSSEANAAATCTNSSRYNISGTRGIEVPSVGKDSYNTNCVMGQGAYSHGVWVLQRTLKYCYGKNIALDNDFGPATRNALIQVQGSLNIARDGVYGPQTRSAIKWYAATPRTCHKIYF